MAEIINLPTFSDRRGNLTVIEKIADFDHEGDEWVVIDSPDDPLFIEVGE